MTLLKSLISVVFSTLQNVHDHKLITIEYRSFKLNFAPKTLFSVLLVEEPGVDFGFEF